MNSVKKKIVLYLDSEQSFGGGFQYNQSILEASLTLPRNKYKVVVVYTGKIWEQYLRGEIETIYVHFGKLNKKAIQFLIMTGIQLNVIRYFLNRFHPVAKTILNQNPFLCIFPSQETFWGYITKMPSLVTIHDLMHRYEKHFKEVSGFGKYIHKENHLNNICKYSKGILVESELGKHHVHESYNYPLDNISVLPLIPQNIINNIDSTYCIDHKYKLPLKYIFYPAQFWPHKNHIRLIKAVEILREELTDIQLVLTGSKKYEYEKVARLVKDLNLEGVVHFLGFVPERDLAVIYRRATALVLPTFFGPTNIPPLEAFALGCPVAVSNVYGMSEQVGDAGLLFDPKNVADIAEVIKRLWLQDDLRQWLIQKGFNKAKNWCTPNFNNRFVEIVEDIAFR